METTMSNSSKNELTSSREMTADELDQVTGGMGPVFLSRMSYPTVGLGDIRGESTDNPHSGGIEIY
jgi:hypothetical protein